MFGLGFIFKVNDSLELSVVFVPLVLADQTPMVEVVCFFSPVWFNSVQWYKLTLPCLLSVCPSPPGGEPRTATSPLRHPPRLQRLWLQPAQRAGAAGPVRPSGGRGLPRREGGPAAQGQDSAGTKVSRSDPQPFKRRSGKTVFVCQEGVLRVWPG